MRVVLLMVRVSLSACMSKYKQYQVTDIYISYSQTLSRPVNDEILTDLLENSIFAWRCRSKFDIKLINKVKKKIKDNVLIEKGYQHNGCHTNVQGKRLFSVLSKTDNK